MFGFTKLIFARMISIVNIVVILGLSIFGRVDLKKEFILNAYNKVILFFGDNSLTNDNKLKGKREYGVDHYVGTYTANYTDYTGEEILFGGTIINRKNKEYIKLKIKVKKESGNISVINKLGNNEITLIDDTGEYENNVYIEGLSYYLIVRLDNFKGYINIETQ